MKPGSYLPEIVLIGQECGPSIGIFEKVPSVIINVQLGQRTTGPRKERKCARTECYVTPLTFAYIMVIYLLTQTIPPSIYLVQLSKTVPGFIPHIQTAEGPYQDSNPGPFI